MPVRVEKNGPVTTVILNRPEVRNAVDHATALELQIAFRAFEVDRFRIYNPFLSSHFLFDT